jgi:hypothetical protein
MLMRMELEDGLKPVRQINQRINSWPGGVVPYLYGAMFFQFVEERYGREKVNQLVEEYSDNLIPFRINSNSESVLGNELPPLWDEFENWLTDKYARQKATINAQGLVVGEPISAGGYATSHPRYLADGSVVFIQNNGVNHARLVTWSPGDNRLTVLADVLPRSRFDWHEQAGLLVVQPELSKNTNLFYDLFRVDEATGRLQRLTEGARLHFIAWHPDGDRLAAVRMEAGSASLVIVDATGGIQEVLWQGKDGEVLSGLDWSPRGDRIVSSVWRPGRGWDLEVFSPESRTWQQVTRDTAIQMQPRFSSRDDEVVFSADYQGVFNIQKVNLQTGRIVTMTNVPGGAFHPSLDAENNLVYAGYHGNGYDIYRVAANLQNQVAVTFDAGSSYEARDYAQADLPVITTAYSSTERLAPTWWSPFFGFDDDFSLLGAATAGNDPLNRHIYAAGAGYEFSNDEPVAFVAYNYDRWYPVLGLYAARNISLSRSTTGEISRVRKVDDFDVTLTFPFLSVESRWQIQTGVVTEKESDSWRAANALPARDTKDNLLGVGLTFNNSNYYPLSFSRVDGRAVSATAETSNVLNSDFEGSVYTLDWREFLRFNQTQVLALRFVQGWGTDRPRPFQLGGSGVSSLNLDVGTPVTASPFNHRDFGLRGYDDGFLALTGRRMQLLSAEWRFPLRRVERGYMAPPAALDQFFGAFFVDSGDAWFQGSSPDKYYTGAGFELGGDVRLFYHLPLRVILGYAHGFDDPGENQAYIRLGSAF